MHIRRLNIRNVRSIPEFEIQFKADECAGWHVILGDNGSGKSSVVRALAIVLMGAANAHASRQDWANWLRDGEDVASIDLLLAHHVGDTWTGKGNTAKKPFLARAEITRDAGNGNGAPAATLGYGKGRHAARTLWGHGSGWFSASFGPYRRFSGGDPQMNALYYSHPRLAPHLSALGEQVATGEALAWLRELHVKALEGDRHAEQTRDSVVRFVNDSRLLPHNAKVADVSSAQVTMVDGDGACVSIEEMSDGYRSILSLTLELLRLMENLCRGGLQVQEDGRVRLPGVVVIDEVDSHLHPSWQKRIGEWFVERFPETQFVVTTHSPIVCRAAARGSIWALPAPGSGGAIRRVTGTDYHRLVDGNVLDAYSTELFGHDVLRSSRSKRKLAELARLNRKRLQTALTARENARLALLRATLGSTPNHTASE